MGRGWRRIEGRLNENLDALLQQMDEKDGRSGMLLPSLWAERQAGRQVAEEHSRVTVLYKAR